MREVLSSWIVDQLVFVQHGPLVQCNWCCTWCIGSQKLVLSLWVVGHLVRIENWPTVHPICSIECSSGSGSFILSLWPVDHLVPFFENWPFWAINGRYCSSCSLLSIRLWFFPGYRRPRCNLLTVATQQSLKFVAPRLPGCTLFAMYGTNANLAYKNSD